MMTTTPTSTNNQTTKVKRPREGGALCNIFFFGFCFVVGFFSPLCFYQAQKVFYHQESNYYLQIKHNKSFYHKVSDIATSLVFLIFCHSFKEIAKEKKK
jgi:hypothetical protein